MRFVNGLDVSWASTIAIVRLQLVRVWASGKETACIASHVAEAMQPCRIVDRGTFACCYFSLHQAKLSSNTCWTRFALKPHREDDCIWEFIALGKLLVPHD